MFETNKRKKLIIVSDEKTKPYANYLMALISANDDKEGEIVGIEDGSVEAVVWSEKDFAANEPTLSSNAHILFIGDNKISKEQRGGLTIKFNNFGMRYGWLGKRAVMYVESPISDSIEYESFFEYASSYQENMTKVIEKKTKTVVATGTMMEIDEKKAEQMEIPGKAAKVGLAALAAGIIAPIAPIAAAVAAPVAISKGISFAKEKKEIMQQQYSCLTMVLYLEGLTEFLEG